MALQTAAWDHLAGGRKGPLDTELLTELAGRAKAAQELATLPFEAIQSFYQEEENATEVDQD